MGSVGGIVLAGGSARRLGTDKALLRTGGLTFAQQVVSALGAAGIAPIVVVRGGDQPDPLVEGAEVVVDGTSGLGPLEGIRTGLAALAGRVETAVVAPVDAPRLEPALVRVLLAALAAHPEADAAVPVRGGRLQPLTAAYRVSLLPLASRLLDEGERRARALPAACEAVLLDEAALLADAGLRGADPELASLDDVDERADLDRLEGR